MAGAEPASGNLPVAGAGGRAGAPPGRPGARAGAPTPVCVLPAGALAGLHGDAQRGGPRAPGAGRERSPSEICRGSVSFTRSVPRKGDRTGV